ncbi:site-2 protease family protein [Thermogladius sp. 4427co]|uniref:site-2 protease family protein n=1 Tax=Thermogladius sp. 4427co TaxID=3450718 RepID=UPI003F7A7514
MEASNSFQYQDFFQEIIRDISNLFSTAGVKIEGINTHSLEGLGLVVDIVLSEPVSEDLFRTIYGKSMDKGFMALQLISEKPVIRLVPVTKKRSKWKLPLFIATFATVFASGYGLSTAFYTSLYEALVWGLVYTIIFLSALAVHEFGHILASKSRKVIIDGPFFIPAPPIQLGFIGTFGAVINMRTLPPDRRSLSLIGLSGPLMGFLAGLVIAPIGIVLSQPVTVQQAQAMVASGQASPLYGIPLVFQLLEYFIVPKDYTILLHPLAFISYIVFLVTFLNLIPIGQLDGGHVVRSYTSGSTYELIGWAVIGVLLLLGLVSGIYLWIGFIALIFKLLFGRYPHPGSANQNSRKPGLIYLVLYLVMLILTFPIP